MRPEVGMDRNAGNLNFSLGHPAIEQLSPHLRRGHEISVNLWTDPCIVSIIIGNNGTQRHIDAQSFQTRDDRAWYKMGTHNDVGFELSNHVFGACIEHSVKC